MTFPMSAPEQVAFSCDRISVSQVKWLDNRSYNRFWYIAESMISTTISTR